MEFVAVHNQLRDRKDPLTETNGPHAMTDGTQ